MTRRRYLRLACPSPTPLLHWPIRSRPTMPSSRHWEPTPMRIARKNTFQKVGSLNYDRESLRYSGGRIVLSCMVPRGGTGSLLSSLFSSSVASCPGARCPNKCSLPKCPGVSLASTTCHAFNSHCGKPLTPTVLSTRHSQ